MRSASTTSSSGLRAWRIGWPHLRRLRLYGLGVLFVAFLGWAYLTSRVKPRIGDYLEYLETTAEEDGHVDWLDQVESEFKFKWGIEKLEALTDG